MEPVVAMEVGKVEEAKFVCLDAMLLLCRSC